MSEESQEVILDLIQRYTSSHQENTKNRSEVLRIYNQFLEDQNSLSTEELILLLNAVTNNADQEFAFAVSHGNPALARYIIQGQTLVGISLQGTIFSEGYIFLMAIDDLGLANMTIAGKKVRINVLENIQYSHQLLLSQKLREFRIKGVMDWRDAILDLNLLGNDPVVKVLLNAHGITRLQRIKLENERRKRVAKRDDKQVPGLLDRAGVFAQAVFGVIGR